MKKTRKIIAITLCTALMLASAMYVGAANFPLVNGDFSDGINAWGIWSDDGSAARELLDFPDGNSAAMFIAGTGVDFNAWNTSIRFEAGRQNEYQSVFVESGEDLTLEMWVKMIEFEFGNLELQLTARGADWAAPHFTYDLSSVPVGEWTRISVTETVPQGEELLHHPINIAGTWSGAMLITGMRATTPTKTLELRNGDFLEGQVEDTTRPLGWSGNEAAISFMHVVNAPPVPDVTNMMLVHNYSGGFMSLWNGSLNPDNPQSELLPEVGDNITAEVWVKMLYAEDGSLNFGITARTEPDNPGQFISQDISVLPAGVWTQLSLTDVIPEGDWDRFPISFEGGMQGVFLVADAAVFSEQRVIAAPVVESEPLPPTPTEDPPETPIAPTDRAPQTNDNMIMILGLLILTAVCAILLVKAKRKGFNTR